MNQRILEGRARPLPLIILWVTVFASIDLFTVPMIEQARAEFLLSIFFGSVLGQAGLVLLWAVLGPQQALARWLSSLAVGLVLISAFLCGTLFVSHPPGLDRDMLAFFFLLPLGFLILQWPLWLFKLATGFQIVREAEAEQAQSRASRQFSVLYLLGMMTVLAVVLGLARAGMSSFPGGWMEGAWATLAMVSLFYGFLISLGAIPCLLAAFRMSSASRGLVAMGLYSSVLAFVIVVLIMALSGGRMPGEFMLVVFVTLWTAFLIVFGSLSLLRSCGYVMVRAGRKPKEPVEEGQSPFETKDGDSEGDVVRSLEEKGEEEEGNRGQGSGDTDLGTGGESAAEDG